MKTDNETIRGTRSIEEHCICKLATERSLFGDSDFGGDDPVVTSATFSQEDITECMFGGRGWEASQEEKCCVFEKVNY